MTTGEFVTHAIQQHGCEVLDSGTAKVIRLYNPRTGGKVNLPILKEGQHLFPYVIQMACVKLMIPVVKVDEEI